MRPRYAPSGGWYERNEAFVLKFIALFIIVVIVLVATDFGDKIFKFVNPDLEKCEDGECKYECIFGEEFQVYSTKCVDNSKVCCIQKDKIQSRECSDKTMGDTCNTNRLCDEMLKCISLCEYCAKYPQDSQCMIDFDTIGRNVESLNQDFSCKCTESDCEDLGTSGLGTCVRELCPSASKITHGQICCDK